MFQPAGGGADGIEITEGLVLRVLTRDEIVARIRHHKIPLGVALEWLASDYLLKHRIAELEDADDHSTDETAA